MAKTEHPLHRKPASPLSRIKSVDPGTLRHAHNLNRKQLLKRTQAITTNYRNQKTFGTPAGRDSKQQLAALRGRMMAFRKALSQELLGEKGYKANRGGKHKDNRARLLQRALGKKYLDYYTYKGGNRKYGIVKRDQDA
ncbi:MAG: hypothetical protein ACRDMH_03270 [Solirubrobacterales bacterium]